MGQIIQQLFIAVLLTAIVVFILFAYRAYRNYKAYKKSNVVQTKAANKFKTDVMGRILKDLDKMPIIEIETLLESMVKYEKLLKKLDNPHIMKMLEEVKRQLNDRKAYLKENLDEDIKLMQYQIQKMFLSLEDEDKQTKR